jgi:hypothetical protein
MATGGGLIGALRVSLGLDTAQFEAGSKRARGIAKRDATDIQRTLSGIRGSLNNLVAGATITALAAAAKRALDYAGSLGEISQQLGVTTKDLQTFRYVASQVGVEQEEMDKSLAKLTRTMGEAAAGSKVQATAFRELGVSLQDGNGKLLTASEVLPRLADAFAKIKDPATRARLEADLFGKAGQKLDPLLTQGAKGVKALTDRAEELGLVLGDDLIRSADAASDKLAEMQKQLEATFARTMAESADAVMGLANAFATLTSQALHFINEYPRLSGALAGAAIGARGGPIAAGIGGLAGLAAGSAYDAARNNGSMDLGVRRRALVDADRKLQEARRGGAPLNDPGGKVGAGSAADRQRRIDAAQKELRRQAALYRQAEAASASPGAAGPTGSGALPTVAGGRDRGKSGPTAEELAAKREELRLEGAIAVAEAAGDEASIRRLREQEDIRKRVEAYDDAGLTRNTAMATVLGEQVALELARGQAREKDIAAAEEAFNLEVLRERGELNAIRDAERKLYLEERTAFWIGKQKTEQEAQSEAVRELAELDEARAEAAERRAASTVIEHRLTLARLRGDSEAKLRQIEREGRIDSRAADIYAEAGGRLSRAQAGIQATGQIDAEDKARRTGEFRDMFKDGFRAAMDRDLGGWFENWWKDRVARGTEDALNKLADLFERLLNSIGDGKGGGKGAGAGNLGGILSAAASLFGPGGGGSASVGSGISAGASAIPRFANGGAFRVGGIPGVDRNLLSINGIPRAMVSATENVRVAPANDRGGQPIVINLVADEGAAFVPRVAGIAGQVAGQQVRVEQNRRRQQLGTGG